MYKDIQECVQKDMYKDVHKNIQTYTKIIYKNTQYEYAKIYRDTHKDIQRYTRIRTMWCLFYHGSYIVLFSCVSQLHRQYHSKDV